MIVIGIGGAARAGKDSAAKVLVEDFGFVRIGLADTLKSLAQDINPVIAQGTLTHMNEVLTSYGEDEAKRTFPEYRRFLINLGMAMRERDEDFWVDSLLGAIINAHNDYGIERFVVPDVRFENEIKGLQRIQKDYDRGSKVEVWKIYNRKAEAAARETGQPTERLFDANHVFNRSLNNNADIENLHMQVRSAAFHILEDQR